MGQDSGIQWTTHTFNPWEGCAKVSDGCKNCYAEERNERFHQGEHWGPDAPRLMRGDKYWNEPLKWDKAARLAGVSHVPGDPKRPRVFCASLADVFEDRPDLVEPRARLFRLIEECDRLDWLLLTKRPQNVLRLTEQACKSFDVFDAEDWPGNVWIGTTVENQAAAEERLPYLVTIPSIYRFVSVEPQIGPVDLSQVKNPISTFDAFAGARILSPHKPGPAYAAIDWVIVGGESGKGARPFELDWARSLVEQCKRAQRPVFVKQLGVKPRDTGGLIQLEARKGSDPSEWPEELRHRMFPGDHW